MSNHVGFVKYTNRDGLKSAVEASHIIEVTERNKLSGVEVVGKETVIRRATETGAPLPECCTTDDIADICDQVEYLKLQAADKAAVAPAKSPKPGEIKPPGNGSLSDPPKDPTK